MPDDQSPIVLMALDWCEIRNEGWDEWRRAIADSAGTEPNRVAVQCVHPHDAPFADPEAERLLRETGATHTSLDLDFFYDSLDRVAKAAREGARCLEPVSHIGTGSAEVNKVASNRRILGPDRTVTANRWSSCRSEPLRAEPQGLIDPLLRTLSFWSGERLQAALHYYAVHPMSHYGQGEVSCDFCGLAREEIEKQYGGLHLYFTGCAGNLSAGKYNDGSHGMRSVLTGRIYAGMERALAASARQQLETITWRVRHAHLTTRAEFSESEYRGLLEDRTADHSECFRGATGLAWLRRNRQGHSIPVTCLTLNHVRVLHLPGEPFVEYQLFAQACRPHDFVAVAGYGDCGPGYIPTAEAFDQGGYEAGWAALVGPEVQGELELAIQEVLERE